MTDNLNSQITDSVAATHLLTIGQAGAQSMAIIEAVGAETIGASMHNAVLSQSNAQTLSAAAMTAACARILGTSSPMQLPTPVPPATSPPSPPPPPQREDPLGDRVAAERALDRVITDAEAANQQAQDAQDALRSLAEAASRHVTDLEPGSGDSKPGGEPGTGHDESADPTDTNGGAS